MKTFQLLFESLYSDEVIKIIEDINMHLENLSYKDNVELLGQKVKFDEQDRLKVDELNKSFPDPT